MSIELPEVPEGFFWRVGNALSYSQYGVKRYDPAVMLMEKVPTDEKPPIPYVDRTVEGEPGNWNVERARMFFSSEFYASEEFDVPEFAVTNRYVDYACAYYYTVGLDAEGIRHLAEAVLKFYNDTQDHARVKAEEARKKKEQREHFFGDYPPKTLEGK